MKYIRYIFIVVIAAFYGCPMAPGSRKYMPTTLESQYFNFSSRCILPNDINLMSESELENLPRLNWVGIIENVEVDKSEAYEKIILKLSHKYWDFIEDFSIQDEKMFVSDKGEGDFIIEIENSKVSTDSLKNIYKPKDLAICYGRLKGVKNETPILSGDYIRPVPYKYYSTTIWRYDVKKDSINGRTICNEKGKYEIVNLEILKIPKAGQNK